MNARPTISLPTGADRREAPRKPSMIAKGHDAILKGFQDRGAIIEISPIGYEGVIKGKMINRDRYTITVEMDTGRRLTVYKHAIESFGEAV